MTSSDSTKGLPQHTRMEETKGHTKILLLGDSEVGKTSILLQYCDKKFSYDTKSTFGESTSLCSQSYCVYVRGNSNDIGTGHAVPIGIMMVNNYSKSSFHLNVLHVCIIEMLLHICVCACLFSTLKSILSYKA